MKKKHKQIRKVSRKNKGRSSKISIKTNLLEAGKKYIMVPCNNGKEIGWFKFIAINSPSLSDCYVSVSKA